MKAEESSSLINSFQDSKTVPLEYSMKQDNSYPDPDDVNFQKRIYEKIEFHSNVAYSREKLKTYEDEKEFRGLFCGKEVSPYPHQAFLSNFLNLDTTYRGVLAFHGTGTGKTCAAIFVGEKMKPLVQRYGTKIYILINGPVIKEVWYTQILKCTGETYAKYTDKTVPLDEGEKKRQRKMALNLAFQYYKIMSYRSFYRKVLGDKILDKGEADEKKKYRKNDEGDYERARSVDTIDNLNNTLLIIDEAHNITGNAYGQAVMKIIKASSNLRVLLLTATPMKNLGSDIIELLNFIRPQDSPILREKVFTNSQGHALEFKEGGLEYLKNMSRGYVSYLRGEDPLLFAKKVEMGDVPKELLFTKVTKTTMSDFQKETYNSVMSSVDDTLDRRSEAVANMAFPSLTDTGDKITGVYGPEGIIHVKKQLKIKKDVLNKKITELLTSLMKKNNEKIEKMPEEMIMISESGKSVTGPFLKKPYLKFFSSKFDEALSNINELVYGKDGPKTGFVYSNLVRVGIDLFQEVLIQNGWLEYQDNYYLYNIVPETVCYYCGYNYADHHSIASKDTTTHKVKSDDSIPMHLFYPATFITVTGKATDETMDTIPEEKFRILRDVFNHISNKEGKFVKLVLGSRVMNEGVSLENVTILHILDVHYNLGRVTQVTGRIVRTCSHYGIINDKTNRYPFVKIYKYVISLDDAISSELELYRKAELKHLTIKQIERILKMVAIDCPLNRNGNIFKEDLKEFKDCKDVDKSGKTENQCPAICDYTQCDFVCENISLNAEYYDPNRKIYRTIAKNKLDYSTFTTTLAKNEIEFAKTQIKNMYRLQYTYKLPQIMEYVKQHYGSESKKDLFDEFFVFKALDELVPLSENDFNNFKDTVLDMYGREGYIIYRKDYYIFQPSNQNENVPMYYRSSYVKNIFNTLSLYNYIKNKEEFTKQNIVTVDPDEKQIYDFDSVREYYEQRPEYDIVGSIDKELGRKNLLNVNELPDTFKIRTQRDKVLTKKRGKGIPSLRGSVCKVSKQLEYLVGITNKLKIKIPKDISKAKICDMIQEKLLELEKYNTDGITYVIIPKNHPTFPFPYNLNDRVQIIQKKIKDVIRVDIKIKTEKKNLKDGKYLFKITIQNKPELKSYESFFKELGAKLKDNEYVITVD